MVWGKYNIMINILDINKNNMFVYCHTEKDKVAMLKKLEKLGFIWCDLSVYHDVELDSPVYIQILRPRGRIYFYHIIVNSASSNNVYDCKDFI